MYFRLGLISAMGLLSVTCSKKSGGGKKSEDPPSQEGPKDKGGDPGTPGNGSTGFSGALNLNFGEPDVAPPAILTSNTATITGVPTQDVNTRTQFDNSLPGPMKKSVTSTFQWSQWLNSAGFATDAATGCNVSGTVTHAAPAGWPDGNTGTCADYEEAWFRFFKGSGPTDVLDKVTPKVGNNQPFVSYMLDKLEETGSRCLSMPASEFTGLKIPGTSTSLSFPVKFSCLDSSTDDGIRRLYGFSNNVYYYADLTAEVGSSKPGNANVLKINADGSGLELYYNVGRKDETNQTQLFGHLLADSATGDFEFTGSGSGSGPDCGFHLKSKRNVGGFDYLYLDLNYPSPGGSPSCTTDNNHTYTCFKSTTGDLNGSFTLVTGDATCGGAATFTLTSLSRTNFPDHTRAYEFGQELLAESYLSKLSPMSTQDPVRVMRERVFKRSGPTDAVGFLEKAKSLMADKAKAKLKASPAPECLFQKPTLWSLALDGGVTIGRDSLLSCVGDANKKSGYGQGAKTDYYYGAVDDSDQNLWSIKETDDGALEGFRARLGSGTAGSTWQENQVLFQFFVDPKNSDTEYSLLGGSGIGVGCGVKLKTDNTHFYVAGKFDDPSTQNQSCALTAYDQDCIKLGANVSYERVPMAQCHEKNLTGFKSKTLERTQVTPEALAKLKSSLLGELGKLGTDSAPFGADKATAENPPASLPGAPVGEGENAAPPLRESTVALDDSAKPSFTDSLAPSFGLLPSPSYDMFGAVANCLHTNGADKVKALSAVYTFPFSKMTDKSFEALVAAAKAKKAFASLNYGYSTFALALPGKPQATPSHSLKGTWSLFDEAGNEVKKGSEVNFGTKPGYYTFQDVFNDVELKKSMTLVLQAQGQAKVACESDPANSRQANVLLGFRGVKLQF